MKKIRSFPVPTNSTNCAIEKQLATIIQIDFPAIDEMYDQVHQFYWAIK